MRGPAIIFPLVLLSTAVLAQPKTETLCRIIEESGPRRVQFDPAKTRITFGWDGLLDTISFFFQLQSGQATIDLRTGTASGEIVVDARSGKGGNVFRNRHFHEQVLQSDKYPEMRFHAKTVSKIVPLNRCACRFDVGGMLELRGKQEPFKFQVDIGAVGKDLDLTARSSIVNWSNFGALDYGKLFFAVEDSAVYIRAGVQADSLQMPTACNNPTGVAGERKPY